MTCLRVFMKRPAMACVLGASLFAAVLAPGHVAGQTAPLANKSLSAFASEEELSAWLKEKKDKFLELSRRQDWIADAVPAPAAAPAPAQESVKGEASSAESVTNNQTAGVDEGGIVKVHKSHLVILRRGRLFTVRVGDDALRTVDMRDAFARGSGAQGGWYDEMLVSGDTIVVIGYNYSKGGTEVGLFGIDDHGRLSYRATYVLRSNDYYSSRNYASRLVGNTLIFYTPLYLNFYGNPLDSFPGVSRWQQNERPDFKAIAPATRIYRAADDLDPMEAIALHTVTSCEIAEDRLQCTASAVLGAVGREFYVARDAVYVWSAPWRYGKADEALLPASVFRLPLNSREAPTALKTYGSPVDQFSFLESEDGYLNVVVRGRGSPSMWASEGGSTELALLRTPWRDFGDGSAAAPSGHYHPLPTPKGGSSIQNRYIGDTLVYGAGQSWWKGSQKDPAGQAHLLKLDHPDQPEAIALPHRVDRIEALGKAPLLVGGSGGDLYFSVLDLEPSKPMARIASTFRQKDAAQGETRSHGFFYKPDAGDGESGLLGLPYAGSGRPGWKQLKEASSGVIFLKNNHLHLEQAGALTASGNVRGNDDQCKASCTDWYGNSRPLFVASRIFALMGFEIVEGKMVNNRLKEIRRINFMKNQGS